MPVSPGYQTFVLDQLRRVVPSVRARRMFGAVGLYAGELFFALIDDDVLYLKVDDETRPEYEARGLKAFQPFGEGTTSMNYHEAPEDALEDPESLRPWAERALAVARRAKTKPKKRSAPKSKAKAKSKSKSKTKAKTKATTKAKAKATTKANVKAKGGAKRRRS